MLAPPVWDISAVLGAPKPSILSLMASLEHCISGVTAVSHLVVHLLSVVGAKVHA